MVGLSLLERRDLRHCVARIELNGAIDVEPNLTDTLAVVRSAVKNKHLCRGDASEEILGALKAAGSTHWGRLLDFDRATDCGQVLLHVDLATDCRRFQLRLPLSGIYRGPDLRVKNGVIRVVGFQRW